MRPVKPVRQEGTKYPAGQTPADRMERLAALIAGAAEDVRDLAAEMREEAARERAEFEARTHHAE